MNTFSTSHNKISGNQNKEEMVDLKELISKIWFKRKFIIRFTIIFMMLGLILALTLPVSYTASSTIVPQMGSKKGGGLSGIASMMGVNIGSPSSAETLSPYVYPQIINSVPFCKEIMETPIVVEKSNGDTITLFDFYTDNQYRKTNILGVVKKYTIGLPRVIQSFFKSDSESILIYNDIFIDNVVRLTKNELKVIEIIQSKIQFNSNDKDGYIKLGYSFSEAKPTAYIAKNLHTTLEKYVTNYKSQKQLDNLEFIEESYERAHKDFVDKQTALASFQDANRGLSSAMARTTERSLTNDYQVAYTVYNELAVQLEQAKIAVKESTPILIIIDPVVIPNKKSKPNRGLVMIVVTFFGLIISMGWVFMKPFIQEMVTELKEENEMKSR